MINKFYPAQDVILLIKERMFKFQNVIPNTPKPHTVEWRIVSTFIWIPANLYFAMLEQALEITCKTKNIKEVSHIPWKPRAKLLHFNT